MNPNSATMLTIEHILHENAQSNLPWNSEGLLSHNNSLYEGVKNDKRKYLGMMRKAP